MLHIKLTFLITQQFKTDPEILAVHADGQSGVAFG